MRLEDLIRIIDGKFWIEGRLDEAAAFYAGDLLPKAMCAPAKCAWFTVVNDVDAAGAAVLADMAAIVLCGGAEPDETMLARCDECGIAVISTPLDVFSACAAVGRILLRETII